MNGVPKNAISQYRIHVRNLNPKGTERKDGDGDTVSLIFSTKAERELEVFFPFDSISSTSKQTLSHSIDCLVCRNRMVSYKVELAVYDLSMGMAASLSSQFLGPDHAIPMVPHTAVLAYGREYFFSSGIQNMDPQDFRRSRHIQPVQIITIGNTTTSRQEFEQWCQGSQARSMYNEYSYDLFTRNCNNFSDFALRNGLGFTSGGVPEWILDVPRKVSSSPMGQMIMPMLNGMQAPFSPNSNSAPSSPTFQTSSSTAPASDSTTSTSASKPEHNPWANIPASTSSSSLSLPPTKKTKNKNESTPFLDSHSKLLLSNDPKTVPLCIKKLKKTGSASALEALEKDLTATSPRINPTHVKQALWQYIHNSPSVAENEDTVSTVMALMLLRLVVLHPFNINSDSTSETITSSSSSSHCDILSECLHSIASQLVNKEIKEEESTSPSKMKNPFNASVPARCMAWCTLSNAFVNTSLFTHSLHLEPFYTLMNHEKNNNYAKNNPTVNITYVSMEDVIDCAILDLTSPRNELRQAASAFLHNFVHAISTLSKSSSSGPTSNDDDGLPEWTVTLLCASLDGLADEEDHVTQIRRLLVVANVIQLYGTVASSLVKDLGFEESLKELPESKDVSTLSGEILDCLLAQ